MTKQLFNATQEPKVYYCKHIKAGVCGYDDETILIEEDALKKMDPSFAGKPVYVDHQTVDLPNLQEQADGYVSESFFLPEDGCHWAKFIAVSDKAHAAIKKGCSVSNAYLPEEEGAGGEWHNLPYKREITGAKYTHLALVENPRYEEAEIMTPEGFKAYKEAKREQLNQLTNSKTESKEKKRMFKLFKKQEVKNSEELAGDDMVELSNGKTVSIAQMVNAVEKEEALEKKIKVNGKEVKIKDLVSAYEALENKKAKKNEEDEEKYDEDAEEKKENDADEEEGKDKEEAENSEEDEETENDDEEKDADDKENDADEDEEAENGGPGSGHFLHEGRPGKVGGSKKSGKYKSSRKMLRKEGVKRIKGSTLYSSKENSKEGGYYAKLLGAAEMHNAKEEVHTIETPISKLARGAERYGSSK